MADDARHENYAPVFFTRYKVVPFLMDLRVFDQRSKSYENKNLHQCYVMNKNDKKTLHLVLSSRKSNFYPISFSSKWSYGQRN